MVFEDVVFKYTRTAVIVDGETITVIPYLEKHDELLRIGERIAIDGIAYVINGGGFHHRQKYPRPGWEELVNHVLCTTEEGWRSTTGSSPIGNVYRLDDIKTW